MLLLRAGRDLSVKNNLRFLNKHQDYFTPEVVYNICKLLLAR